jgi:hypothetical protein
MMEPGGIAMNHSIVTADRRTHLKVVVVALVAAIVVVSVGIANRLSSVNLGTDIVAGRHAADVKVGVVKPTKSITWTGRDELTIR